jgi:hypothetical protein
MAGRCARSNQTLSRKRRVRTRGGWAGIRTLVAFRQTRFPGVRIRPLCHPSDPRPERAPLLFLLFAQVSASRRTGSSHARRGQCISLNRGREVTDRVLRQTAALADRGRCAMQYSSPSRATRNSRLGSDNSVAPHVAHLCNGSVCPSRD